METANGRILKDYRTGSSCITFSGRALKWEKIEHRMFCYISKNWQGQPLVDIETVISLISSITTEIGLKIMCIPDYNKYELGKTVSDEDFFTLPNNLQCT